MRSPAPHRPATVFALVATLVGLVSMSATAAPARVLKCHSVTIPVSITKTIPLTYVDITVSGVSCTYAQKVFLIDTSKAGAAPPPGWSIKVTAAANSAIQDTCTDGDRTITFRFPKRS